MASYMYTSATGSNWDDDDDDFEIETYRAAAIEFSVSASDGAIPQDTAVAEIEHKEEMPFISGSSTSAVDYDTSPEFRPTYAQKVTESWYMSASRPAYIELSHENGFFCPDQRTNYNANWTAIKLQMGANIRTPIMMKPSPLKLHMTWVNDSEGEFIKEGGCLFPPLPSPSLATDYQSEEEEDEAQTPSEPSPMIQSPRLEEEQEFDPAIDTLGLPVQDMDEMNPCITAVCAAKEQTTDATKATTVETTHITTSGPTKLATDHFEGYSQCEHRIDDILAVSEDHITLTETATLSPHLKYISTPSKITMVSDTVATGWFALSLIPWSRIAVTTVGALVDVIASMTCP